MLIHKRLKNVFLIPVLLGFISCGSETNSLTPEEKYTVDTLYNNQLNRWRVSVDSICKSIQDTTYRRMVDSLKEERMEEIEMLLMKNHSTE